MRLQGVSVAGIVIASSLLLACSGMRIVKSTGSEDAIRHQVMVDDFVFVNTKDGEHLEFQITGITATALEGTLVVTKANPTRPSATYVVSLPCDANQCPPNSMLTDFRKRTYLVTVPYDAIATMSVARPTVGDYLGPVLCIFTLFTRCI